MIAGENVLFDIGAIMLIAFIGAALASRARQSVILGYILVGILIGPNMHLDLGLIQYDGLLQDTDFIMYMSQLGLILLMFFVGLEFSFSKLKKTKAPATILAVINLGINMFAGIILGMALGWPLIDTIFLAGVVAMSSCAITAKSLMELQRFGDPETEYLLGMIIVEDFLAMLLLTVVGGFMVKTGAESFSLTQMTVGIVAFYAFFIILAIWVIPRTVHHLKKIKSEEMFVLFALGVVFISAALAEVSSVPGIIGAFFIGMVFAETGITERLERRLSPFRDAFTAVFFVSFGMLIDPSMFMDVIWIVAIAVPIVIINDVLITGAIAYLIGFTPKGAVAMGTSLCGRGAESVMYATVGSRAVGATKGAELFPFAGAFCFIMSAITPVLMRKSLWLTGFFSRRLPYYMKYSSGILARTISKLVLPSSFQLYHRPKRMGGMLVLFFVTVIVTVATQGLPHIAFFFLAILLAAGIGVQIQREIAPVVLNTSYRSMGVIRGSRTPIARFVADFVLLSLITVALVALLFPYSWYLTLIVPFCYLFLLIRMMKGHCVSTAEPRSSAKVSMDESLPWESKVASSRAREDWKRF